jgi:RNA polymerase sigma-70 factor (ECF subfamily)
MKPAPAFALSWASGGSGLATGWTPLTIEPAVTSPPDTAATTRPDLPTLFSEHYDRLVRSITVICGNSEEAADAVQEAFVKAHLKWRKISTYDDPVGWVRRVAINKVRDSHRSRLRRDKAVVRLGSQSRLVSEQPETDEIGALLAVLPKQQRIVAALFYVEQLHVSEIAAELGLSEGAVKFHLHQAREKLRHHLDHQAESERT